MSDAKPLVALSLQEPWAWAILFAGKDVENRGWSTMFRGRVVLHASKTWDGEGDAWLRAHGLHVPDREQFSLGAYVGEVNVTGCVRMEGGHYSPWAFGPWCFTLHNPVSYDTPVPGRGRLGFYEIPPGERFAVVAARELVGLTDAVLIPGEARR